MAFTLKSAAFENLGTIPKQFTCDGRDVSPPLSWSEAPEKTASFALAVDDPDAPRKTWVHWVVCDLPASATGLPEAVPAREVLENGGRQGVNDFKKVGWGGPCPPSGTHNYVFTLYALDRALSLPGRFTREDLTRALRGHVLAEARLTGRYSRK
jgi:Raf kinase inhibitor-like YbhB/YbcL family protein